MYRQTASHGPHPSHSKESPHDLPLCYFSLVIIVEPDRNHWVENGSIQNEKLKIWEEHCKKIADELDSNYCYDNPELIDPYMLNKVIAIINSGIDSSVPLLLNDVIDAMFIKSRRGFPEDLVWYLESAIKRHPHLRIAIVGGVLEHEINQIADYIRKTGVEPIIVQRCCLSKAEFQS